MASKHLLVSCLLAAVHVAATIVSFDTDLPAITNPLAIFLTKDAKRNDILLIQLQGVDTDTAAVLTAHITALPSSGLLYQTSHNFQVYGYEPKAEHQPMQQAALPLQVTDSNLQVVYKPPRDVFEPQGQWTRFKYRISNGVNMSEEATVIITNAKRILETSSFILDNEGWTIQGNLHMVVPTQQIWSWGPLNRYIDGNDDNIFIDASTGLDKSIWHFVSGPKFSNSFHLAYNGVLEFWLGASSGNFSSLNSPLPVVQLHCASCRMGVGLTLIYFADTNVFYKGGFRLITIGLSETAGWVVDPGTAALPYLAATRCQMLAVLSSLTHLKILGDYTTWKESVAVDSVVIYAGDGVPQECQFGCSCAYSPLLTKLICC